MNESISSKTSVRTFITATSAACALVLAGVTAQATTFVNVSCQTSPGLGAIVLSSNSTSNVTLDFTAVTNYHASYSYGTIDASGTGWGTAQVGTLHLDAAATATAGVVANYLGCQATADVQGSWDDHFTLNAAPAYSGQLGSMTVTIYVGGSLFVSGYYGASTSFQFTSQLSDSAGTNNVLQGGKRLYVDSNGAVQTQPLDGLLLGPGILQRTVYFHFGRSIYVKTYAHTSVYADANAYVPGHEYSDSEPTSDFGHTIVWSGISDVRDAAGNPVTVTNVSDSGYDYLSGTAAESPVITRIQLVPQGLELEWTTDAGPRSYTIETSASVIGGSWASVAGVAWPIQANTVVLPLPSQSPAFFRVKVQ